MVPVGLWTLVPSASRSTESCAAGLSRVRASSGSCCKFCTRTWIRTLHFFGGSDGRCPVAGLVLGANGNFYGTTGIGGANSYGTVFKITPTGKLTTLHSFDSTDGANPSAGLVQAT